jgi:hypothetical protein
MARPGPDFKDKLLDVLLEIPAFKQESNRDFLVRHLPKGPVAAMSRHRDNQLADLSSIVDTAHGMGQLLDSDQWAIVVVARDAVRFARGTEWERALEELLGDL